MSHSEKRLFRSKTDRILLGVCGGLGDYFDIDSTIFRIIFIVLAFNGIGILLYIIMAIILPSGPETVAQPNAAGNGNQGGDSGPSINKEKAREFAEEVGARTREMAEELKTNNAWQGGTRNVLGLIIIFVGLSLLLRQFFPFYFGWLNWNLFWPVVLIFIGLYFIIKNRD